MVMVKLKRSVLHAFGLPMAAQTALLLTQN